MLGGRSWGEWIALYSKSHQHPVNRFCHTQGIPLISLSLPLGLEAQLPDRLGPGVDNLPKRLGQGSMGRIRFGQVLQLGRHRLGPDHRVGGEQLHLGQQRAGLVERENRAGHARRL